MGATQAVADGASDQHGDDEQLNQPTRATADTTTADTATDPGAADPSSADDDQQTTAGRLIAAVLEWITITVGSLFIALLIRLFLVQSFFIPSGSMQHTLTINDRVLVNKLSYEFSSPSRGDVVVFNRPPNLNGPMDHLIKRVIAIGGDTVEGRNGQVLLNGVVLDEPYVDQGVLTSTFAPIEIPEGQVWVMGDNRTNSADSRVFGAIQERSVIGRSFVQIWPISGIELL